MTNKRSPYDFYPTPRHAIDSLIGALQRYTIPLGSRILEPCAGDGALLEPLHKAYPLATIQAYDIDESHLPQLREHEDSGHILCYGVHDILTLTQKEFDGFNTIITNPPFSISQEILEHLLTLHQNSEKHSPTMIIILQRLGFLGSQKRHEFWNKYPPDAVWALSKRPSFTGTGTDAHEYGWFIWGDIGQAPPIIAI